MSISDENVLLPQRILTMRIILGALIAGCLAFMAVAVVVRQGMQGAPPDLPIMTYLSFAFAVVDTAISFFAPDFFIAAERRKMIHGMPLNAPEASNSSADFVKLIGLYQTRMIISAALIEGCVFFFIIAYLLEGYLYCLFGALVLLGIMATKFPNRDGVERWVEAQRELQQQERAGI